MKCSFMTVRGGKASSVGGEEILIAGCKQLKDIEAGTHTWVSRDPANLYIRRWRPPSSRVTRDAGSYNTLLGGDCVTWPL